ncbi:MAG: chromate transporter, partial [Lachnospiraceae bacterium]|nr:chromate transporter [Lachnospiraceae bacterium]
RVCVCVLVFNAVVKLWKKSVVDKKTLVVFLIVMLGSYFTDITPTVFVVLAGIAGILLKNMEAKA